MINSQFVIELLIDGATLVPCLGGALLTPIEGSASVLVPSMVVYEMVALEVIELVDGVYVLVKDKRHQ